MVKHSKYQKNIFTAFNTTNDNLFIEADPGSGKSYTILQLAKQVPGYKKSIMLAFNKSIAEELKTKVPSGVDVSTIHSLAFRVLRRNVSGNFKLQEIKNWIIGKKILPNYFPGKDQKKQSAYLFTINRLVDLYRMNLVNKSEESITKLADDYSVDYKKTEIKDTIKLIDYLEKYNTKDHRGSEVLIDFTDMLWLANNLVDDEDFPKYDVVFVDEVQDLNPLQKSLIMKLIKRGGRFVCVGDPKQSIYSFMGSSLKSFNEFKDLPNTKTFPLSVCYRCGSRIIEEANKIFPGTESFEGNEEGIVRKGKLSEVKPGDMVICRNNLPLVETYLKFLELGKKSHIMGRDFGKSLLTMIDKIDDISDFERMLKNKVKELQEKGIHQPYFHKSFVALKEKIEIIKILLIRNQNSLEKVSKLLNFLFSDKNTQGDIILMTGHKAKGLESDRVFWLWPELIPSEYAKTETEFYQEKCLKYVITTRAKKELVIINKPKQEDVENLIDMVVNSDIDQMQSESNLD